MTKDQIFKDVTLSISNKNLKCSDLYSLLKNLGINSSISENKSIQCKNGTCWIENGCRLFFSRITKEEIYQSVWLESKKKYNLNCAHLKIPNKFNGCINDFNRLRGCK